MLVKYYVVACLPNFVPTVCQERSERTKVRPHDKKVQGKLINKTNKLAAKNDLILDNGLSCISARSNSRAICFIIGHLPVQSNQPKVTKKCNIKSTHLVENKLKHRRMLESARRP